MTPAECRIVELHVKKPEAGSQRESFYLYDVTLDGEFIVAGSRDPECDAPRALLARGITGIVDVIDGASGKLRSRINVEKAAKLTAREDRREGPRFVKWRPLPETAREARAGAAHTGETAAGVSVAHSAIKAAFSDWHQDARCSRDTASRALRELDDAGLIRPLQVGVWRGRRATEYR